MLPAQWRKPNWQAIADDETFSANFQRIATQAWQQLDTLDETIRKIGLKDFFLFSELVAASSSSRSLSSFTVAAGGEQKR